MAGIVNRSKIRLRQPKREGRVALRVTLSGEQLEIEKKRDGFLLHRTRVLRDLENCQDPRYRKTLEGGLAYLETQLTELGRWRKRGPLNSGTPSPYSHSIVAGGLLVKS